MLHAALMDLQPGLIRLLARAGREWWPVYLSLGKQWSAQLWSAASNPQTSQTKKKQLKNNKKSALVSCF